MLGRWVRWSRILDDENNSIKRRLGLFRTDFNFLGFAGLHLVFNWKTSELDRNESSWKNKQFTYCTLLTAVE